MLNLFKFKDIRQICKNINVDKIENFSYLFIYFFIKEKGVGVLLFVQTK